MSTSSPPEPEERAERRERQLAAAQRISHVGSWEWDLRTNAVTWSDEMFRIYGMQPGSRTITFEFAVSRVVSEHRERIRSEVTAALHRGGRFAYVEHIVRSDGLVRILDTVGEVIMAGDKPFVLIGTSRDITDERQREERLSVYEEIVRRVQIALFVFQLGDDPHDVRLIAANAASDRAAGATIGARLGARLADIFPDTDLGDFEATLRDVLAQGVVRQIPEYRFARLGDDALFDLKIFPLSNGAVGVAAEDVTARTRARVQQSAERRALEMIASDASLEQVLEVIVLSIESMSPGTIASILLLDADGVRLRHGAAPSLPPEFNRQVAGARIGPLAGSCGTAAFERRTVVVSDIETDPHWEAYRGLAEIAGVKACWSTPLIAPDGTVLGTFALYYRERRDPTPIDMELVSRATHIAQIAIKRRLLDDQLRALSGHIEAAREEERTGIARELHDELGQGLTAIKLDAAWIARRSRESKLDRASLEDRVDGIVAVVDGLVQRVRKISAELRPGVLDDLGLNAAVEWQCRQFQRRTATVCEFASELEGIAVDPSLATGFFRILQEALTNVARHAEASRVSVLLERVDELLVLTVTDNGSGISERALSNSSSLGLLGIRERARRLGGTVTISRVLPHGTRVRAAAPMRGGALGSPR